MNTTMMMSNLEVNMNHETNILWKPTTHTICVQEAGEVSHPFQKQYFVNWTFNSLKQSALLCLETQCK